MSGEETFDVTSPYVLSRLFEREEPAYLALGMTHDEYWNGPANLPRVYRRAEELRRDKINSQLWIQGMYFYEALCDASPLFRPFGKGKVTAHPYAKEPYDIYGNKTRREKRKQRKTEKDNMEKGLAYMHKFMAAFNNRIKGGDKSADD